MHFHKTKKIILNLAAIAMIVGVFALLQTNFVDVRASDLPVGVSTHDIKFGVVFPGENMDKGDLIVSYTDDPANGVLSYFISRKRKPLPGIYEGSGDPAMPGYYRDLCPYLRLRIADNDGDTEVFAQVGPDDPSDSWIVNLKVPAIFGNVAQDHRGGVVSTNGDYGCDLAVNVFEAPFCGDGTVDPTSEQCDDGNRNNGDGCSLICTDEGEGSEPFCGDGIQNQTSEQCDDNNLVNLDGCSATCQTEPGGGENNSLARLAIIDGGGLRPTGGATGFAIQGTDASTPLSTGASPGAGLSDGTLVLGKEGAPILTIKKTAGVEFANPESKNIPFSITLKNEGNLTAFNAIINDKLPAGMVYSDDGSTAREWKIGDLLPGGSRTVNYEVNITKSAKQGELQNTASASADLHPQISDTAKIEVRPISVLGIELPASGIRYIEAILLASAAFAMLLIAKRIKKIA
jgi:uncharacterized repeat protein (TIGR01451 family)